MNQSSTKLLFLSLLLISAHPLFALTTSPAPLKAIAIISPASSSDVHGIVRFENSDKGVHIVADLSGLVPGSHGFHIHQWGDISSANGTSAGPHFNPSKMSHGGPHDAAHHAGDLGNIEADVSGNAHLDTISPTLQLSGDTSIIGRSVVVHQHADDMTSQPAGNAGARIGVGVIGIGN